MPPTFAARSYSVARGVRRTRALAPAVGADWTLTVPGGAAWRALLAFTTFTASAAVANRQVAVQVLDGDLNIYFQTRINSNITAGQSQAFQLSAGGATGLPNDVGQEFVVIIPDLVLDAGWTIRAHTFNLQAGDQWAAFPFLLEELFDEDVARAPGQAVRHLELDIVEVGHGT